MKRARLAPVKNSSGPFAREAGDSSEAGSSGPREEFLWSTLAWMTSSVSAGERNHHTQGILE